MKESIDFMEQNLTEELEIEAIAGKAALSPFYFQRIFGALQGYSLAGDYDVEIYLPPMDGREEMTVAIWVPLKKD